jgi:predicted secreted protein
MAVRKILARELTLEVEDSTPGSWLTIGGLRTLTLDNGKTDADTTDFDSGGWAEHMVAERSGTITLAGLYLEDADSGARDAGQERCEELALLVGAASLGSFQVTTPGGTVKSFTASVNVSGPSGGHNDPAAWSATLTLSGQASVGS